MQNALNRINLNDELLKPIKEFKAPRVAKNILHGQMLTQLVKAAISRDHMLSSRAMWVFAHCSDLDYSNSTKYHKQLIKNLENKNLHNGVIRNTLRLFQQHPVPKNQQAFLLDICFKFISDPLQAIAVRAFAITIVFNISKPYKELLLELYAVLNNLSLADETPGIKSRVKNTIKQINKVLN